MSRFLLLARCCLLIAPKSLEFGRLNGVVLVVFLHW